MNKDVAMYRRINSLKSKISQLLLVAFVSLLVLPGTAMALDVETGKAIGETAKAETASIVDLLRKAVKNEPGAINELISSKVVPALVLLAALVLTWTVASSIGRYVGGKVSKKVDLTLGKFLTKAVRNLIMVAVAIGVLGAFKIDVTSFAAVLAALGFAVGGTSGNAGQLRIRCDAAAVSTVQSRRLRCIC